jgi:PAS domain S-box-containing protein
MNAKGTILLVDDTDVSQKLLREVLEAEGYEVRSTESTETALSSVALIVAGHKRAQEALRETNEYLDNLFNYANAPIIVWDPQFRITRFNRAFESTTGRSAQEVIGHSLELLFPPTLVDSSMGLIKKTLKGERWETVEIAIQHRDGSVRTLLWNSATLFAADGKTPVATIAQGHDITERNLALEALRESARELQQKNDELARFTYTVSHDLKSPLVTIKTFLGYLEKDIQAMDRERMEKDMKFMGGAADKMSRLLDELLDLSRVGRKMNEVVDVTLQDVVHEAMDLVAGRLIQRGVVVAVTEERVLLNGDRTRLVEVFQNLLDNAASFMGGQASPRVEIGVEREKGEEIIFVRDNGMGIDARHLPKLFGLFEKLDPRAEGTGIGLALVKRIVEVHGGTIWVESEGPGKGSTFRLKFGNATMLAKETAPRTES